MPILIAGATGATGRLLVSQLLDRGHRVRAIVRDADRLPPVLRGHPNLSVIEAPILDLSPADLERHVAGCVAIACCLGHNLTPRGLFGRPHLLVTEAVRRLAQAAIAHAPAQPIRIVLMNTAGNRNRGLDEPLSMAERAVLGLLRTLLPPHRDNEAAAEYLRGEVGPDHPGLPWVVVRPDTLIDAAAVSPVDVHPSPIRSAIFDAGTTSRVNVAAFMADLITDDDTWTRWQGQMPVIYDRNARPPRRPNRQPRVTGTGA